MYSHLTAHHVHDMLSQQSMFWIDLTLEKLRNYTMRICKRHSIISIENAILLLIMALAGFYIVACAEVEVSRGTGTLEGHVTIGPLVPVVREGEPEPTPSPEVYAARKIVIYTPGGKTEIARVSIDSYGNYQVALQVGRYVVDINRIGIDRAADLPKTVEIFEGQVTRLDIDIDTGIR